MIRKFFSFTTFFLITIITTVIAGILFRLQVPDCGLSKIKNIEDIQAGTITLNYAWGMNSAEEDSLTEAAFQENDGKYLVDSASIIAVASPTGNLRQTEGSIGQEIIFQKIIKGEEMVSEQQKGYVYQYFGFHEADGAIQFMNTLNLMYPENEYLIFLEASPLNPYTQEPTFLLSSSFLGYININGQGTQTLDKNYGDYDFLELKDYEFFSVSPRITDVMNNIRKELLSQYINNNK